MSLGCMYNTIDQLFGHKRSRPVMYGNERCLFTYVAYTDQRRFKPCFAASNDSAGLADSMVIADIGDLLYALVFSYDNYLINSIRALQSFQRVGNDRSPAYGHKYLILSHAL